MLENFINLNDLDKKEVRVQISKNMVIEKGVLSIDGIHYLIDAITYICTVPALKIDKKPIIKRLPIDLAIIIFGLVLTFSKQLWGILIILGGIGYGGYTLLRLSNISKINLKRRYALEIHLNNGIIHEYVHDWDDLETRLINAIKESKDNEDYKMQIIVDGSITEIHAGGDIIDSFNGNKYECKNYYELEKAFSENNWDDMEKILHFLNLRKNDFAVNSKEGKAISTMLAQGTSEQKKSMGETIKSLGGTMIKRIFTEDVPNVLSKVISQVVINLVRGS